MSPLKFAQGRSYAQTGIKVLILQNALFGTYMHSQNNNCQHHENASGCKIGIDADRILLF
jgi:hypothetical protein